MSKIKTHYDHLNVSRDAPTNVIKAAYKTLCQTYHPDKYEGGPEEALWIIKGINAAYAVLSDPDKRAEHDQWIDKQERKNATNEAQRMRKIIAKTYVTSSAMAQKSASSDYRATIDKAWKNLCSGCGTVQRLVTQHLKKVSRIFWLSGAVGMVLIAIIVYMPALKTTTVTTSANQEVTNTLKKAKQFVQQGQVVKALPLYFQLAEQNNAEAQFQIGLLYANGQGLANDDKEAVKWFSKAAEQGYMDAQTKLGFMYAAGKGVAQSYTSAIYWCYKAAEQGDATAQYNLGLMYAKGRGVAQDNNLALSWYNKAAAQGDAHAQYNLGVMYANGDGVAKDKKQAVVLYQKAAKQGLAEAIEALKQLER